MGPGLSGKQCVYAPAAFEPRSDTGGVQEAEERNGIFSRHVRVVWHAGQYAIHLRPRQRFDRSGKLEVDPHGAEIRRTYPLAFADKQIACRDCGTNFVFTAGEQEFYANKGLMNEPTRCQSCRSARRTSQSTLEQNDGYVRYGNFASFGGKTPRQMHPASCADCGQMTEVPFVPRGERPVYCSNCYSKIKPREEVTQ